MAASPGRQQPTQEATTLPLPRLPPLSFSLHAPAAVPTQHASSASAPTSNNNNGNATNYAGQLSKSIGDKESGAASGGHGGVAAAENRMTVLLLRCMTVVLSSASMAILITDKQTEQIFVNLPGLKTPLTLSKTARFNESKALQFIVAANAAAVVYSFSQAVYTLCLLIIGRPKLPIGNKLTLWCIFLLDQTMAYVLLSALGASVEVAYLAKNGNADVGWDEICSSFKRFCSLIGASVIFGFVAFCNLAALAVLSAFHLFTSTSAAPGALASGSTSSKPVDWK